MRVRFYWTESARAAFDRLCREHRAELLDRAYGKIRSVQLLAKKHPEYSSSRACFWAGAEVFLLYFDEEARRWLLDDANDPDSDPPSPPALKGKKKAREQRAAAQQARRARRTSGGTSGHFFSHRFEDEAVLSALDAYLEARAFTDTSASPREPIAHERPISSRQGDMIGGLRAQIQIVLAAFGAAIQGAAKLVTFGRPRSGKTAFALSLRRYQQARFYKLTKRGQFEQRIMRLQAQRNAVRMPFRTMRSERARELITERERIEAHLQRIQKEFHEARMAAERAVSAWIARSASDLWLPADVPRVAAEGGVMDPQPEPGAQRSVPLGDAASVQKEPGRTRNSREEGYFDALFTGPPRNYRGTSRMRIDTSEDETV